MEDKDNLLTMNQLVKEIGKTRATIHSYIRQGMPFIKKGRNNFFNLSEVLTWLRGHKISDEYVDLMIKVQTKFPEDPIKQIEYLNVNSEERRTYAIGMVEIIQKAFNSDQQNIRKIICLNDKMLDYFFRGMLDALNHIPQQNDHIFLYIANRIETLVIEAIKQRYAYKYNDKKCNTFWGSAWNTMEKSEKEETFALGWEDELDEFFYKRGCFTQ